MVLETGVLYICVVKNIRTYFTSKYVIVLSREFKIKTFHANPIS